MLVEAVVGVNTGGSELVQRLAAKVGTSVVPNWRSRDCTNPV